MSIAVERVNRANEDALWPASRALQFLGVKKSVFYELAAEPDFPDRIVLGKRAVRWRSLEIIEYAERRRVTKRIAGGAS